MNIVRKMHFCTQNIYRAIKREGKTILIERNINKSKNTTQ